MKSFVVPHLYKVDRPENFIADSSSSSNQKIFDNVDGAPTTQMNYNKYCVVCTFFLFNDHFIAFFL